MRRDTEDRLGRPTHVVALERTCLVAGILLIGAGLVIAMGHNHVGGPDRTFGLIGLGTVVVWALACGVRLYKGASGVELPTSVARVPVRIRPARAYGLVAVVFGLVFPAALCVALLALVPWIWPFVACVMLVGCIAALVDRSGEDPKLRYYIDPGGVATGTLERLAMRAGMQAPELVVEHRPVATAWTEGGEVHVTRRLLELLDRSELEAVLAHELAHLARRDAPVMEICSGPSRVLLGFVTTLTPRLRQLIVGLAKSGVPGLAMAVVLAAFCIPPAFVTGWISRLSVLVLSRARELSADAAAAALTGRPSALASALLKLEHQRERTPRADLREFYAQAVLCIVGTSRRRLGRLISTHPPTAVRVRRLEQLEARLQAGPYAD